MKKNPTNCPTCYGEKRIPDSNGGEWVCPKCNGTGIKQTTTKIHNKKYCTEHTNQQLNWKAQSTGYWYCTLCENKPKR